MKTPRPYQVEACDSFFESSKSHKSALLVMATGLGKTMVMGMIADKCRDRGACLLLAHRIELLDQAADHFTEHLGYRPQIIQSNREIDWHAIEGGQRVIIGSVQTLKNERRLERLSRFQFALLMVDEAHHATAKSYRKIEDWLRAHNPDLLSLGVTATPRCIGSDRKAMGLVYECNPFKMEAAIGIAEGWLVEPIENRVILEGVDFADVPITFNEMGEPDFSPQALEALMIEEGPLHAVARPLLECSEGRSVLAFTAGVAHAHLLAAILNREKPGSAAALDGKSTPPGHPDRERILREFREKKIQYLCNFGICTEGVDLPECSAAAIARPTKSKLILIQMVGRTLRPLPGVVDGHDSAEVRKAAIATSVKPTALILYYSPKTANIKTATTFDALAGNMDEDVVALAKEMNDEEPGKKVSERLAEAALLYPVLAQNRLRQKLKAEVAYRLETVGAKTQAAAQDVTNINRGGATDKQIEQLLALGVGYKTAAGYTAKQAFVVVDKLRQERCTNKQRGILERFGENPNVNFEQARNIINEIVANGWEKRAS